MNKAYRTPTEDKAIGNVMREYKKQIKIDGRCFAYRDGKCRILCATRCLSPEDCKFHKGKKQAAAEKGLTNKRLSELPFEKQQQIADKYYGGLMPWYTESTGNAGCY